jgi:hypothetical protein
MVSASLPPSSLQLDPDRQFGPIQKSLGVCALKNAVLNRTTLRGFGIDSDRLRSNVLFGNRQE